MLNMGMGTGKSRTAITIAQEMQCRAQGGVQLGAKQVLVLCPLSVCDAWSDQFSAFGPEYEVVVLNRGSVKDKVKRANELAMRAAYEGKPFVVVINYESARNNPFAKWAEGLMWDLLILDESHRIKSPSGKTSKWVRNRMRKSCRFRLALTGTPLPHSPMDIWSQYFVLDPTLFGYSFTKFRSEYAVMGGYQNREIKGFKRTDKMQRLMAQAMYRCDRSVLDLPDATHQKRVVDLGKPARKVYDDLESDFCAQVKEGEITATNALVKLLRLAQTTSGSVTVDTPSGQTVVKVDDAKEKALADLLSDLPADEPVVVFGRFRADIDAAHAAAKKVGRRSLELSGSKRELKRWQGGEAPILVAQIQSGSTGIDLTRSCVVCFLSTGYSLGDYVQALARSHRPGQKRSVSYYHFVARDTVDEKVYDALRSREQVVESVLSGIKQGGK